MKKEHGRFVHACDRERERGEEVEGNGGLVTTDNRLGPFVFHFRYVFFFFFGFFGK